MINTTLKYILQIAVMFCFLNGSYALASTNSAAASVLRFQTKMAERGAVQSQYKLGFMHETGSGVEQNLDKAIHWYEKASSQGFQPANDRLMYLQIKSAGIKNEHIHWISSLKKSAKSDNKDALFLLGQMYAEGTGVNKSLTISLKLLRKAARKNITSAESHISRIEDELATLQEKYAVPEANKNIKKLSSNMDKAAIQKISTPNILKNSKKAPDTTKPKSAHQKKNVRNSPVVAKAPIKHTSAIKQKPIAIQAKKIIVPAVHVASSIPVNEPHYSHPMDMICGGRNRFMSACR